MSDETTAATGPTRTVAWYLSGSMDPVTGALSPSKRVEVPREVAERVTKVLGLMAHALLCKDELELAFATKGFYAKVDFANEVKIAVNRDVIWDGY